MGKDLAVAPNRVAPGAKINVAVSFAVDTGGTFWFGYDVDAN